MADKKTAPQPEPIEHVWMIKDVDPHAERKMAFQMGIPLPVAALYVGRGLDTPEKAKAFCDLTLDKLHDPMLLPDIEPALVRLEKAIQDKELIHVHGDYDVDGVTSTSVMAFVLKRLQANFTYTTPHRMIDGYGIKVKHVEAAAERGVKLLITVDNGIVAFEPAKRARELGVDLIITDHHHPAADHSIPECVAVVNPNRHDSTYPFDNLAGVGIAFKVMQALCRRRGIADEKLFENLLDWVAMGTVADIAEMADENRVMVRYGMEQIIRVANDPETKKVGLKRLLQISDALKGCDTMTIGFRIGPRINAVGRLADSGTALALMMETSASRADDIAKELDGFNDRRKTVMDQHTLEASEIVSAMDREGKSVLLVGAKGWHTGVVGLVSSRITETYGLPSLVYSIREDGTAKGSARSIQSFNLIEALQSPEIAELFIACGGHPMAAGFELKVENLPLLDERMQAFAIRKYGAPIPPRRIFQIDAVMMPEDIRESVYAQVMALAPFGSGHSEPVFMAEGLRVRSQKIIKEKHLKLSLTNGDGRGLGIQATHWSGAEAATNYPPGALVDVVFTLDMNDFQGRRTFGILVKDIRPSAVQSPLPDPEPEIATTGGSGWAKKTSKWYG